MYLIVLLASYSWVVARASSNTLQHPFPMAQGTSWIYKGVVRWTDQTRPEGANEKQVTWRCEVRRYVENADVRAALIKGWPSDLDWSDGTTEPKQHLLVESAGGFYLFDDSQAADLFHKLETGERVSADSLSADGLFLKWPLSEHEKFCDPEGMARSDSMYCWFVDSRKSSPTMAIAGVGPAQDEAYSLIFRTNPDHVQFTFVPGVGITEYEYHHHGTVADTELSLASFSQPTAAK